MPDQRLGQEAILYYGNAGSLGANTALGVVQTNSPSSKHNEVKGNYRDYQGQTSTSLGNSDKTGTVKMRKDVTNAGYQAIRNAHYGKTAIALRMLPYTGATNAILDGDFVIPTFDEPEDNDAVQETTFTYAQNLALRYPTQTT